MEKKIPTLTVQLLTAIAIVLALLMVVENYLSIRLSDTLQVQFTFIPHVLLGAIAGPFLAALVAAITDPVFVMMSGQSLIVTWILIEAVSAFLYGWFFYRRPLDSRKKKDWLHVSIAFTVIQLVISFALTPLALHLHFGTPLAVLYSSRLVKAVFELPMRIIVTMVFLPQLQKIPEFSRLMGIKK